MIALCVCNYDNCFYLKQFFYAANNRDTNEIYALTHHFTSHNDMYVHMYSFLQFQLLEKSIKQIKFMQNICIYIMSSNNTTWRLLSPFLLVVQPYIIGLHTTQHNINCRNIRLHSTYDTIHTSYNIILN